MTGYPPQPWDLRGQQHVSTFLVPAGAVPFDPPPGWRPVRLGGRVVVGASWVSYEPGGVLSYREVMATVLVRRGRRVTPHIIAIWVDSESSRDGGRALWAIPKELATFAVSGPAWSATEAAGPIAASLISPGQALPGRLPVRFSIVQSRDGGALVSPVRVRARAGLSRITWDAAAGGPLGYLAGRRPLLSFSLRDFRMTFGR